MLHKSFFFFLSFFSLFLPVPLDYDSLTIFCFICIVCVYFEKHISSLRRKFRFGIFQSCLITPGGSSVSNIYQLQEQTSNIACTLLVLGIGTQFLFILVFCLCDFYVFCFRYLTAMDKLVPFFPFRDFQWMWTQKKWFTVHQFRFYVLTGLRFAPKQKNTIFFFWFE